MPWMVKRRKASLRAAALAVGVAVAAGVPTAVSAATATTPVSTNYTGTLPDGTTWTADVPAQWNGTLLLYSHGFGPLVAQDAPDPATGADLLAAGYALAGSSYDPNGSEWALDTAVSDQFGTLSAVESTVLPSRPAHVLAVGTSMGGLISALEAQNGAGKLNGALTTCGIVGGGVNLNEYQIDGEYAIAQLLGDPNTQLVGFGTDTTALATASALTADATAAQATAAGRARLALALAFLNATPWLSTSSAPVPGSDPNGQEAAQYDVMFGGGFSIMDFIELGRVSVDQADGGNANWDVGTDFAQVLDHSPFRSEVASLYREAGLNLNADLATLTANTSIKADPAALRSLDASSVPTGRLAVPELDLHTVGDNLVPVQNENFYRHLVDQAGSGGLLRQAYTESFGHCNFSSAELIAGVQAVMHRVTTGHWDSVATTASLEQAATALNLGPARFTDYQPGPLTGATPGPGTRFPEGG